MANRKQRRHPGKPQGMTYADQLARRKAVEQAAREATLDRAVQIQADIRTQRMLWLACVAMNDAWQVGPERFRKYAQCLTERTEWYEKLAEGADEEYADEKLRQEAERCSGMDIQYLYEAEMRRGGEYLDRMVKNNYQRMRMLTIDQMARFIPEEFLGLSGAMLELAESAWGRWLRETTEIRRTDAEDRA